MDKPKILDQVRDAIRQMLFGFHRVTALLINSQHFPLEINTGLKRTKHFIRCTKDSAKEPYYFLKVYFVFSLFCNS